ncbi:hypothetical protein DFR75_10578 [Nocardia ignorata]|uniref:Uncharacterized protein n=1 Tax=Nocardia ignorata TaxID=145285 RepID=A0A4R6P6X1_NOCIG|nr:hypothetical protein DFR75_10578 [Nocardia ignorata]
MRIRSETWIAHAREIVMVPDQFTDHIEAAILDQVRQCAHVYRAAHTSL